MHYFTDVLKKYFVFAGRASRKEFWMFYLWYTIIIMAVAIILSSILSSIPKESAEKFASMIFLIIMATVLGLTPPYLAVTVRRLHDVSKSGWWILISLIPLIGGIWLLVLLATKGDGGRNEYGEDPYWVTTPAPIAPSGMTSAETMVAPAHIENVVVTPIEPISQSDIDKVIIKPDLPASEF